MLYTMLGSNVCMHGNFHIPKSIIMPCLGQVFACMEISIHPKVAIRVKCLPAWKFPYTQKSMPYSGQVFACMEISIHPKVYAVVFACLEISIHPKVYAVVFACLEISIHPKVYAVVFACLEISIHPKVYTCRNCCMNFFMQVYSGSYKAKKKKAPKRAEPQKQVEPDAVDNSEGRARVRTQFN